MRIEGLEDISDIFSIFHDGRICDCVVGGGELRLDVDVQYLAERINPKFKIFTVVLQKTDNVKFITWQSDLKSEKEEIFDVSKIFSLELEILESNVIDGLVRVVCDQHSPDCEYCGGELLFSSEVAIVTDENNKEYSIDELDVLCQEYWDEWADNNRE